MGSLSNSNAATGPMAGTNVPVYFLSNGGFRTPELEELDKLWHSKAVGDRLPARSEFDLRELKSVLRHLVIMDTTRDAGVMRFFVRFMGSELDKQVVPMTGQYANEVLPEYFRDKWQTLWCRSLAFRRPTRSLSRAEFRERQYSYVESLFCPLSDDGATQTKMMAVVFYHQLDVGSPKTRALADRLKAEFDAAPHGDLERF
jgi:hypothetical protein